MQEAYYYANPTVCICQFRVQVLVVFFFFYYQPVCTSFETLKHLEMATSGVGLVYDSRMCAHENESDRKHPEQPARITSIYQRLTSAGVVARFLSFVFVFSPFHHTKHFYITDVMILCFTRSREDFFLIN